MEPARMKKLMRLAMQEAQTAASEGNYLFGAVMADEAGNAAAWAHMPGALEFYRGATLHYGLGNLFF